MKKIKTAIILCAGFGKRVKPFTNDIPKPLLKINNKTLLENTINLVEKLGIKNILINVFYLKEKINEFVREKKFNLNIKIVEEKPEIMDTGGGVNNITKHSDDNFFLVFNPDTVWSVDYANEIYEMEKIFFSKNLKNLLMVVNKELSFDNSFKGDFNFQKDLLKKNNINQFIFTGCQFIDTSIFHNFNKKVFSMNEIWKILLKNEELYGFESKKNFYHITNSEIYKKLLKN